MGGKHDGISIEAWDEGRLVNEIINLEQMQLPHNSDQPNNWPWETRNVFELYCKDQFWGSTIMNELDNLENGHGIVGIPLPPQEFQKERDVPVKDLITSLLFSSSV